MNRRMHRQMCKFQHIMLLLIGTIGILTFFQGIRSTTVFKDAYWLRLNWRFTQDLFINIGLFSIPQGISSQYSTGGLLYMKSTNVTFLGVARNVGHQLPHVLDEVEKLGRLFGYSQAIFVEGDSTDNTQHVLQRWGNGSPQNRIILNTTRKGIIDEINIEREKAMPREGVIGSARNLGLKYMQENMRITEYVIVVDMDLLGLSEGGVADSFGRRKEWDVVCAHGVIVHGIYRDTYAFRTDLYNTNHHWGDFQNRDATSDVLKRFKQRSHDSKLGVYGLADQSSATTDLLPVKSCFGGLAIYKSQLFERCKYHHRYDVPPYMLDCEHVILHQCMTDQHNARFRSNPVMRLWYGAHSLNIKYRDIFG